MILNTSSLIRNRHKDKFFGIDYCVNICNGSRTYFNFMSTPLDFNPLSNNNKIQISNNLKTDFLEKIKLYQESKIFGFFQNPDIYQIDSSIKDIIQELKSQKHGLFIESNSVNILNDINELESFNQENPLLIAIPIRVGDDLALSIDDVYPDFKQIEKIARSLRKTEIKFGFIVKPIIPKINDRLDDFKSLIKNLIHLEPDFIYPTFSINFDSKKLNNFYDLIDKEKPELKTYYVDNFGQKKSWISENADQLKKYFIFNIKKTKIAYSMNAIISLYKEPKAEKQISLF